MYEATHTLHVDLVPYLIRARLMFNKYWNMIVTYLLNDQLKIKKIVISGKDHGARSFDTSLDEYVYDDVTTMTSDPLSQQYMRQSQNDDASNMTVRNFRSIYMHQRSRDQLVNEHSTQQINQYIELLLQQD